MKVLKNGFVTRLYAVLICAVIVLSAIPVSALTVFANTDGLGTVSSLTLGGVISNANLENAEINYSSIELNWFAADSSIGRNADGWWIGFRVTAPESMQTKADFFKEDEITPKAQYKSSTYGDVKSFWENQDSDISVETATERYLNAWVKVDEQILNDYASKGEKLRYIYYFDWNGDGLYEQTAAVMVDPSTVSLKKDGKTVYSATVTNSELASVSTVVSSVVSNNSTNIITVELDEVSQINWTLEDAEAGISFDGWWISLSADINSITKFDLANAKYQMNSGNGWSTAEGKAFIESDYSGNIINFAGGFTENDIKAAESAGKNIVRQWRFDWDGNGVYEQLVHLDIDLDKLVLFAENGERAYPFLGTVTPLTGGSVTGNTENLTLTVTEASLTWSNANASIGRYTAGWYVGMKVTAPKDYTTDTLKTAKYNNRASNLSASDGWGNWRDNDSSFWNSKDSVESAMEHYICMWMPITSEAYKKYNEANKAIATQYVFDWNGDGNNDQTITLKVIPGDGIILNKVEQSGFAFESPAPADQWVGKTYINTASGGDGTGKITYSIISGSEYASIDETTGRLTFKSVGNITVRAIKAADDIYKETSAEYSVKSIKYPQEEFKFANSTASIEIDFSEGEYSNIAFGGSGTGEITYSIISGEGIASVDENTGKVTFIKAGDVTVKATKAADDAYNETTVTYILKIKTSEQEEINVVAPTTITYSSDKQSVLNVNGGNGNGVYKYSVISGQDYASIDTLSGAITTKMAGGSFTVEVFKEGDGGYSASQPKTVTLYVNHAEQTGFAFEKQNPEAITYNDNGNVFTNVASGGYGTGEVTYSIISGNDIAEIDVITGELAIKAAGTIEIQAVKAQDSCYQEVKTTYTLTVNPDTPEFTVNDIELTYGVLEKQISINENPDRVGTGKYTYEISGTNNIGATVNDDGLISFADSSEKVGTITVLVTKEADEKYAKLAKELTVTMSYLSVSEKPILSGDKKSGASDWYVGEVTATAPEGYIISCNNELLTNDWAESVEFNNLGENNYTVYLKNISSGYISNAIILDSIKIDTETPKNLKIVYDTSFWDTVLNTVTFGIYNSDSITVTLSATDEISTVDYFTYNIGEGDIKVDSSKFSSNADGVATYVFNISKEFRNKISMTATDFAGWTSELADEKVLVVDTVKPGLNVKFDTGNGTELYKEVDGIIYSNKGIKVVFEIEEANFDIRRYDPAFKVGSLPVSLNWKYNKSQNIWIAEQIIESEGVSEIELTFSDASENKMDTYQKTIVVDKKAPVISINYSGNSVSGNIYNENRTAEIQIIETNFKADKINLKVTSTNIKGEAVNLDEKAYTEYAKNADNWTSEGDVHKLNLPIFDIDGIYTVDVDYEDLAGNLIADYESDNFVIDKAKASNIKIEYSESILDKIFEVVTFKFYKPSVTVTVTAEDITSGVDYFEISYIQNDGNNTSNKASYTTEKLEAETVNGEKNVFKATHEITADARGTVSVNVTDNATNSSNEANDTVLVVDNTVPEIEAEYTFVNNQVREYNGVYYTQNKTDIKFTVTEANFDISNKPTVTVNETEKTVEWKQTEGTDKWVGNIVLEGNGDYKIKVEFADNSENSMVTYEKEVHIDNQKPEIEVTYKNGEANQEIDGVPYYKTAQTATVVVKEHNFKADEVELKVTSTNIKGETVNLDEKAYTEYAKNADNWTSEGDTHTLILPIFDIDGIYNVALEYKDIAEVDADMYAANFVIDKAKASNIKIEYSEHIKFWEKVFEAVTFGYYSYNEEMTVTIVAEDITSGIDYIEWKYTKETGASDNNAADTEWTKLIPNSEGYTDNGNTATVKFVLPADARGYILANAVDRAGNSNIKSDNNRINIIDNVAPTRIVEYKPERILDIVTKLDVESFEEGDNVTLYYENSAEITFKVNEANFYAEDVNIEVNSEKVTPTNWTQNGDEWTGTITISGDGDYIVTMKYIDRSTNEMVEYTSPFISIDNIAPEITVKFDDTETDNEAVNGNYHSKNRIATITVIDHNFRADDIDVDVTAVDIQGNSVTVPDYAEQLKTRSSWTSIGDVHTATIEFSTDAIYTLDIAYEDIIGNKSDDFAEQCFVIDHAKPTDLNITYENSIIDKVLNGITFGFYNPDVTVTITADDITSGIHYFEWSYNKEINTSEVNLEDIDGVAIVPTSEDYTNNGKTASVEFTLPANARGNISAVVIDKAENIETKVNSEVTIVVDNIAPNISIEYEAVEVETSMHCVDANGKDVESNQFNDSLTAQAFYNGDVTAKIIIDEANFFEGQVTDGGEIIHEVGILLTKTDDEGLVTKYEYLPYNSTQIYSDAIVKSVNWAHSGDEHTFEIGYDEDADYMLTIEYADFSESHANISGGDGNVGISAYTSKIITVDKTAPIIDVEYQNKDVIHTIKERDTDNIREYYNAAQYATITVEEHNFRSADFAATVSATDIEGTSVANKNFEEYISNNENWAHNGNVHTIEVDYSLEANYTFNYGFEDLALNKVADYENDFFTVDTTAPENLKVVYEESVLDKVINAITFGFYGDRMKVTISAEDDIAGVYYFVYSYLKSQGVSDVNGELLNDKIEEANNNIERYGNMFETSFTIPKEVLNNSNQFNGTVQFTATDRSENNSQMMSDTKRIVVDNISPVATISYNEPIQTSNDISYYAGDINAKIVINEANFYSEDVTVAINRDGTSYPVNVVWTDESVDIHVGTFTLNEDGDYIVEVKYKDRSNNYMNDYVSNRLTIDTKAPTVNASNVKVNSANKDEKYGFTITANDINLDASSFNPTLTAVIRKEDGTYATKTVSLGNMKTVEPGKTYSFTVDNLEDDAIYTLVCTVKDMSGNSYTKLALEDGKEYGEVRFSINRNGSTFAVDQNTEKLINSYYVYSVNNDVVIEEVNVDPIEIYAVYLNGKLLTEGTHYTSKSTNRSNEWSKRTYSISKELFESEGEYSIVVETTDKADSTAYSDVKNLNVSFVVDQTPPVLTISGLESNGRYQVEEQTVTVIPTDDGGRLYSMKVLVLNSDGTPLTDSNGKDISVRFEMSGEDFLTYLENNNGKVTFTIPEGLENQVRIICNDCAVKSSLETNEYNEIFSKVTVSQSGWIIFYANKPLFYGSIAGVLLLIVGILFLILVKKRKKEEK